MKSSKLIGAAIVLLLGVSTVMHAQNYTNAIGARLGYPLSASFKHFFNEKNAVEAFAGFRSYGGFSGYGFNSVHLGAAYQIHKPIESVAGLQWYFGGGASAVIYNYNNEYYNDLSSVGIGISGYLGLDYKFENSPINLSLDWVPTFVVGDLYYDNFTAGYGALSVRYVLK